MNKLYVFGDSFSKGLGIVDDGHQYEPYKGKENLIWSSLLADYLNLEEVNISFNGISNDMIWDNIINKFDDFKSGDYVIIGLTKLPRFGVYSSEHKQVGLFNKAPVRDTNVGSFRHYSSFAKAGLQLIRENIGSVLENTEANFSFLINRINSLGCVGYCWDETWWKKFDTIRNEVGIGDEHWSLKGHRQVFEVLKKELNK